ncbi:MAG: peptidase M64 [Prevotellaceae bacterium]|nr:peptidase M64 [Prevotellaceae bacterium]
MRKFSWVLISFVLFVVMPAAASRTLRIDYVLSGTDKTCAVSVAAMGWLDGWAGRRHHCDSLLYRGNGQVEMRDRASGRVLYRQAFSTLFQEWQTTEEATRTTRAFEHVALLPMPEQTAEVTLRLYDVRGHEAVCFTHEVDPADILIRHIRPSGQPDRRTLLEAADTTACINLCIVAEGYTAAEAELFYRDAAIAVESIFAYEPFRTYRDRFNVTAVALRSKESGVSVPRKGQWLHTALGAHFDTFYSDRYLTTPSLRCLHDSLAGLPYDHLIVLANTEVYGGGGIFNAYLLTTTHNPNFRPVVVHEFGHSFAGLADEYFYDDQFVEYYYPDIEPWEANITTKKDFVRKWQDLMAEGMPGVGLVEGGGYQSKGVWRPSPDCRMRTNECEDFCPVCKRALERLIKFYTED